MQCDLIRKQWHILVSGEDVPLPVKTFKDMRFPKPILQKLKAKEIVQPTPIQVQRSSGDFIRAGYDWHCVYRFGKDIGFCFAVDHGGIAGGDDDANCSG